MTARHLSKSIRLPLLLSCALYLALAALPARAVDQTSHADQAGLPVYPNATERPDTGRHLFHSVAINGNLKGFLSATTYISTDSPDKVLAFYRARMKPSGAPANASMVQCDHGEDPEVNVRIDARALSAGCTPSNLGSGAQELKIGNATNQRIVAVRRTPQGSEFTLVTYRIYGDI